MRELEDLQKQEKKLLAQQEVLNKMSAHQKEKIKLKKTIWRLKHPKIIKVVKIGKTAVAGLRNIAVKSFEKARPYLEQGTKQFLEQVSSQPKKIVRVKRRNRKLRKQVKRSKNNNPFGFPF